LFIITTELIFYNEINVLPNNKYYDFFLGVGVAYLKRKGCHLF